MVSNDGLRDAVAEPDTFLEHGRGVAGITDTVERLAGSSSVGEVRVASLGYAASVGLVVNAISCL